MEKNEWQEEQQDNTELTPMHSKLVIRVFSILFSPIFGAVLMMYNLRQIKEEKGRQIVLLFGILFTLGVMILVSSFPFSSNVTFVLNIIGAMVISEVFWNKYIGSDYQHGKRSWVKPLLISLLISLPFAILTFMALSR
jgi:hypothetical protein